MYAISCDRCGEADVVSVPGAQEIVFGDQKARLCGRCHAALKAFLAGQDAPSFTPSPVERPLVASAAASR